MRSASNRYLLSALCFLLSSAAWADTNLTTSGVVTQTGGPMTITVNFNPGASSVVAMQFDLTLPAGQTLTTVTPSAALTQAGKSISTNLISTTTWRFIISGFNSNVISSGTFLTAQATTAAGTAPETIMVPLSNSFYSTSNGDVTALPVNPLVLSLTLQVSTNSYSNGQSFPYGVNVNVVVAPNSGHTFSACYTNLYGAMSPGVGGVYYYFFNPPPIPGSYSDIITCLDSSGGNATIPFNFTIQPPVSQNPVITSSLTATGTVGLAFSYQITAINNPTSFYSLGLPSGLSISTTTGQISGTPNAAGSSAVLLSATNSSGTGYATLLLTINAPPNAAAVVSQSVPAAITAGQSYPVSVTMQNTGTNLWTSSGNYHLGSQNPNDNLTWGLNRVYLNLGESIAPGQSKTFSFNVTAPTVPGSYNFQWMMVQDGVQWFGSMTPNVVIPVQAASSASFLKTDTTTQGSWKGVYGVDGEAINSDSTNFPSYAQVAFTNSANFVWASPTSDIRAPQQNTGSSRIASCWYSATTYSIDVNLTDGQTHQVGFYLLDWDNYQGGRSEHIDIADSATGVILSSRTISGFQNGQYWIWNIHGHVKLTFTNLGSSSSNAVLSGIFFGGAGVVPAPVITSASSATGTVGSPFNYQITATNNPASFNASTLPAGLAVNTATGLISGTPTTAGVYGSTITATNAGGTGASLLLLTINNNTSTGSAAFLKTDTTTQGSWKGVYGVDGEAINSDSTNFPSYAQVTFTNSANFVWASPTTDVRAPLQNTGSSRIASCWYSVTNYSIDVNLTDGQTHQVGFYLLDWDNWQGGRSEHIDIADSATGVILSSRTISGFQNGQHWIWNIHGHVKVTFTNLSGSASNAVMSGIFFGGAGAPASVNTATFLKTDAATQGSWKGIYGLDGEAINSDSTNFPSYAQVTFTNSSNFVWANTTTDSRAPLQSAGLGRIASCWYSATNYSIDVNLTDGQTHPVAFYLLDWDNWQGGRSERIDITDGTTGALLDSRTITHFQSGQYWIWNIHGHVKLIFTNLGGSASNAVLSGILFNATGSIGANVQIGMDPSPLDSVRVYPNPVREYRGNQTLTFDQLPEGSAIKIFTVSARLVTTLQVSGKSVSWNLTNDSSEKVASGIYLYLITDGQGNKIRGKFTVIR